MNFHGHDFSQVDFGTHESSILAKSNSYIINSLLMSGVEFPTIFSLIWGDTLVSERFPRRLREIVIDIIQEEEKKNESSDSLERQLHGIAIELLWLLYEREVYIVCEKAIKNVL